MVLSLKNLIVFYLFKHLQKFSLKSIQSLPQELQDYIFERFVFWKSLSDEHLKYFPYGKEILDLANCRNLTTQGIKLLQQSNPNVKYLNLDCHQYLGELMTNSLKIIGQKWKNLESLSLQNCILRDYYMDSLLSSLPNLTFLNLAGSIGLKDTGSLKAISKCKKLKSLNLSECKLYQASCLDTIASNCLELSSLILCKTDVSDENLIRLINVMGDRLIHLDISFVPLLSEKPLELISKHCTNIESLEFGGFILVKGNELPAISKSCKKLKHISFSMWRDITDANLQQFGANISEELSSSLTSLNFAGLKDIKDSGLTLFVEKCRGLTSLNLSGVRYLTDNTFRQFLFNQVCSLEVLDVSLCRQLSLDAISSIATYCPNLRELYLYGCIFTRDEGITPIFQNCTQLEVLNLYGLRDLTELSLQYIGMYLHKLKHLDISSCIHITDRCLLNIAKGCPDLLVLNVRNCIHLSDISIVPIVIGCSHLQRLALNSCKLLTDVTLQTITKHGRFIQYLSIPDCPNLTDSGFLKCMLELSFLDTMVLSSHSQISEATLKIIRQQRPSVTIKLS